MAKTDIMDLLDENLILFHVAANDSTELLNKLSDVLIGRGYVKDTFARKLIEREKKYPTGLPTAGVQVAIPHTDSGQVLRGCILIATLEHPVAFKEMGNGVNDVNVQVVFMLAVNDPNSQIGLLKELMGIMLEESVIRSILEADDPATVVELLRSKMQG